MSYQSINLNSGQALQSFEHMNHAQLEQSLAAAQNCYQPWEHKSYSESALIVAKAATLLRARVDDFAKLETAEMGKRRPRPVPATPSRCKPTPINTQGTPHA